MFPTEQSYGPPFNDDGLGGGWYVMHNKTTTSMHVFPFFQLLFLFFRFAIERTDFDINIWFWSRRDLLVPFEIKECSSIVDPLTWVRQAYLYLDNLLISFWKGFPVAHFPNTYCNMTEHFSEENIIINLTLCKPSFLLFCFRIIDWVYLINLKGGGWAGSVYQDSGCPSTCVGLFFFYYPVFNV